MSGHAIIFSDQLRYRVVRHLAFWGLWLLSYLLLFHYPIHAIKGWSLKETSTTFNALSPVHFFLKTLIVNALLGVVMPQIIFTYALMNWALPLFIEKIRNVWIIVAIMLVLLMLYIPLATCFKYLVPYANFLLGTSKTYSPSNVAAFTQFAIRDQLATLPIIAGFATMIKLGKHGWKTQHEANRLAMEKASAELQLLKAQIHPHFLFNTLNNIYFLALSGSSKAAEMIGKLTGILHYILNECNKPLVPLEKEITMIHDYMALEKIRYGDALHMSIQMPQHPDSKKTQVSVACIAPLLLIPFVENSFKHGASKMLSQPFIKLQLTTANNQLQFSIQNNRPKESLTTPSPAGVNRRQGNIGLQNVKRRLQLLYPDAHELLIDSAPETFSVSLTIPLIESQPVPAYHNNSEAHISYAME